MTQTTLGMGDELGFERRREKGITSTIEGYCGTKTESTEADERQRRKREDRTTEGILLSMRLVPKESRGRRGVS